MIKGQSDGKKGRHVDSYEVPGYAQGRQEHGAAKNSSDSSLSKSYDLERIQHTRDKGEVKDKREANIGRTGVQRRNGSVLT